jgi:hypothetical protein
MGKGMDGHAGEDLIIKVPCGTLVWRLKDTTPPIQKKMTSPDDVDDDDDVEPGNPLFKTGTGLRPVIRTSGGILTVAQGQKYSAGSVLFSYGMLQSDFEIYLPQRAWNTVTVTTSSGDVELETDLEVATLTLHTVSGDAECPQIKCGVADIHTTSGDVTLTGNCCEVHVQTVSGDFDFDGIVVTDGDLGHHVGFKSEGDVSGTVEFEIRSGFEVESEDLDILVLVDLGNSTGDDAVAQLFLNGVGVFGLYDVDRGLAGAESGDLHH